MSFKVMNWAAEQKVGSSTVKLVLVMLADFAGELGQSHYSNARLAEVCETSVDTVQRAQSALENQGLIARIPTKRSDGSRGANLIICLYNDSARAEAHRNGWSGPCKTPEEPHTADCGSPAAPSPEPHRSEPSTPPQLCGSHIEPSSNHQLPTPYPQEEPVSATGDGPGKSFEAFEQAWPFTRADRLMPARREFERLKSHDRGDAIKFAPAYVAECAQLDRKLCGPQRWLRERGWEGMARLPDHTATPPVRPLNKFWIAEGSDEENGWRRFFHAQGKQLPFKHTTEHHPSRGFWRDTQLPPGMD